MLTDIELGNMRYGFLVHSTRDLDNCRKLQDLKHIVDNPFGRNEEHGHVTASALIVNDARSHILLSHHAKLNLWLPPGGHCDSDPDLMRVCRKEILEETGHSSLSLISEQIFDIDIHTIPALSTSREHLHYDVRFAFTADMAMPLSISPESTDLRWVPFEAVDNLVEVPSVIVLIEKLRRL